jgi:hypothetical protein
VDGQRRELQFYPFAYLVWLAVNSPMHIEEFGAIKPQSVYETMCRLRRQSGLDITVDRTGRYFLGIPTSQIRFNRKYLRRFPYWPIADMFE